MLNILNTAAIEFSGFSLGGFYNFQYNFISLIRWTLKQNAPTSKWIWTFSLSESYPWLASQFVSSRQYN